MDSIFLEGIEFQAYHGVSDEEQATGHRYRVDISVSTDTREAAQNDDIAKTVNYAAMGKLILQIGTENRFRLIETLAERIAEQILQQFNVQSVTVTVRKLMPPMRVLAAASGVTITRER
ncbi:MAG: dihydroneopterin aldolase [Armatimonadota bacterium]